MCCPVKQRPSLNIMFIIQDRFQFKPVTTVRPVRRVQPVRPLFKFLLDLLFENEVLGYNGGNNLSIMNTIKLRLGV